MTSRIDAQAAAAEARRRALELAKKQAAEAAKKQAAKKPPSAAAKKLKADEFSTGQAKALRVGALGGRAVANVTAKKVTPADQGTAEAKRLQDLAKTDPRAATEQLNTALTNTDPAYRKAIADGAPVIAANASEALKSADEATMRATINGLAQASGTVGPDAAKAMGRAFAEKMEGGFGGFKTIGDIIVPNSPASEALFVAMMSVPGMGDFAVGMRDGAVATGNQNLSGDLLGLTFASSVWGKKNFEEASSKVDQLNGELNALVQGFGPGDEAKLAAAVAAFKERHKDEYARFEAASTGVLNAVSLGANVADTLPEFARGPLVDMVRLAPKALASEAGQATLANALVAQAGGAQPPLLDALTAAAKNEPELAQQLGPVMTQAVAARVTELKAAGRMTEAHALIEGLEKNTAVMGLPDGALTNVADALHDTLDGKPGALEALDLAIGSASSLVPDNHAVAPALKGLGFVVGVAGLPGDLSGFSDAELHQKIGTVASTLGLGADGGLLAVKSLASPAAVTSWTKILGRASGAAGVIGALTSTIDFAKAAESGNVADMTVAGLNAAAGVAMLIPGGQLIGVGLAVAAFVTDLFVGQARQRAAEHASEDDARAFLLASGMDPQFVEVFANLNDNKQNIGTFVDEVATKMGLTRDQFIQKLNESEGAKREGLLKVFGGLSAAGELIDDFPVFGPRPSIDDLPPGLPDFAREDFEEQINEFNQKRDALVAQTAAVASTLID